MNDSDSSNDDYEGLLKKAIDVVLPVNFDPSATPQNGEEYLQHVMYERKQCKKLMTAHIDRNQFKKNQTIHLNVDDTTIKAPQHFLPSKEWQITKLNDFIEFRKFVHSKIVIEPTVTCFKEEFFINKIICEIPQFSQIIKYSQSSKIRMLQLINKYLNTLKPGESINDNVGTWIYAMLTLLEIPLSPNYCHTLREFAKQCAIIRSHLPECTREELYLPLNVYICLIARYFNQLDLAD